MRAQLKIAILCAAACVAGCYTDPATGMTRFGSKPAGPTRAQLQDQRIAELEQTVRSLRYQIESMGSSVSAATTISEEASRAAEARGSDAVALRREMDTLTHRMDSLEGRMDKVPSTIVTTMEKDRKVVISEVNKLIAESDARTKRAISDAVSRAAASSSKSRQSSASSGPKIAGDCYEHVVEPGQTLSAIAQAYNSNVSAIMKASGITDAGKLKVGQKVYIPVK